MVTVKCTYENGDTIITKINGTFEEAKKYFLNKYFNFGNSTERYIKCVNVEQIKN